MHEEDICQTCGDFEHNDKMEVTQDDNYPRDAGAAELLGERLDEVLEQELNAGLMEHGKINAVEGDLINEPVILTDKLAEYFGYKQQLCTRAKQTQILLLELLYIQSC